MACTVRSTLAGMHLRRNHKAMEFTLIPTRLFLFGLRANFLTDKFRESAFARFTKLIVAAGFFVHDEASAAVARVEPFAAGNDLPIGAIDANASPHLHKRSTERKSGWLLVFNAD